MATGGSLLHVTNIMLVAELYFLKEKKYFKKEKRAAEGINRKHCFHIRWVCLQSERITSLLLSRSNYLIFFFFLALSVSLTATGAMN